MRHELMPFDNQLIRISGVFTDFGWNFYEDKPTILIRNILMDGKPFTEHIWLTIQDELKEVELNKFDKIEFTTRVESYTKDSGEADYAMESLSDVVVLSRSEYRTELEDIFNFSFTIEDELFAKKTFGKPEVFIKQEMNLPYNNLRRVTIGETVNVEFLSLGVNGFEFNFKTTSMNYYSRRLYFNPVRNGQSVALYGKHKFFIPKRTYGRLKELYFKLYYTKTQYEVGMKFEPREAFGKKEYLDIIGHAIITLAS